MTYFFFQTLYVHEKIIFFKGDTTGYRAPHYGCYERINNFCKYLNLVFGSNYFAITILLSPASQKNIKCSFLLKNNSSGHCLFTHSSLDHKINFLI